MKAKKIIKSSRPRSSFVFSLLLLILLGISGRLAAQTQQQGAISPNEKNFKAVGGVTESPEPLPFPFPEGQKMISEGLHPIKHTIRYVYDSKQLNATECAYIACQLQNEKIAFAVETSDVMKIIMIDCNRDVDETALLALVEQAEAKIAEIRQTSANPDADIKQLCH